jgi:hypothetical protein
MDVQVAGIMADLVQILILKSAAREVAALLEPELAMIEVLGESEHAPILMYYYGYALVVMCRFREARPIQDKALALALERGYTRATAYARSGIILQTTYVDPMPLDAFEAFSARAFAESEQANDAYLIGHMMFVIAWNYMHRGLVVEAENWGHRLEKLGHERQDPRSSALALWLLGWIDIIRENYAAAVSRGQECARTALTPFDYMMGTHVVGIAKIMSGDVAEGVETVQGHRELALKNGLAVGALGTEATLGVAMAMRGDLAKSVRWMEALIERCERDYGYQAYADFTRTYLAEIYLALLRAKTRPPLRVLLGNLRFLLTVKRTAPRKAMALLNTALRNQQFHESGVLRSRIEFNTGLLQQRLNQHGLARDHLMRARAGASAQHATALLGKIETALQSM